MKSLAELCEFIVDCEHKTAPIQEEGIPSIRTPNIGRGYFILDGVNRVSDSTYDAWTRRAIPEFGDLILAREAPVGNIAVIPKGLKCCLGQRTVLMRPKQREVDSDYLCFMLLTPALQGDLLGKSGGATVHHLNLKDIRALPIPDLPELEQQRKTASVIKAYDDLIETNRRRIVLLEESARLLYREWFVSLRFPSYETAKFKAGLPEGWAKMALSDLAFIVMGQSPESKYYNNEGEGLPFHQGVSDFGDHIVCHKTYTTQATRIAEAGDILCSVRAPVGRLNLTCDKVAIGRGLSAMHSMAGHQSLLLYQLKALFVEEDMIGGGTIFASVTKKELFAQQLLQPDFETAAEFNRLVSEIDEQVETLVMQNRLLVEARDSLLPKLMSGEIQV